MFKSNRFTIIVCAVLTSLLLLSSTAFAEHLKVVSFNIQFLGHFKKKDNHALAELLSAYDLVFIQELVAPPTDGQYPDGTLYKADNEAKGFFEAMASQGFSYEISEEDTGTGENIHKNSSATEWFVAFYKPGNVSPANDLPHGFIAADRSNHADYERVPYAFPFRAGGSDLVFISVHLQPGGSTKETKRRAHELMSIFSWIESQPGQEQDYVVLGDMNIEDCGELKSILPKGYASLNDECTPTNTNPNGPKPYDHVLYNVLYTANEVPEKRFQVIDLVAAMKSAWPTSEGVYPGDPYDHKKFRMRYSDHHPIAFAINTNKQDDD